MKLSNYVHRWGLDLQGSGGRATGAPATGGPVETAVGAEMGVTIFVAMATVGYQRVPPFSLPGTRFSLGTTEGSRSHKRLN